MPKIEVLVVDDEPLISDFIKVKLSVEAPYLNITALASGSECLEYVRDHKVDCILSDYQMPGMNGIELLMRLKELALDIPVIFITAQGNEAIAREAFKLGASDYFTKDIGFAHFPRIINSVEQAVSHARARREKARAEKASQDYARKLVVLTEANRALNTVLEIPVVMRSIVEYALRLVDGTSGAAGRYIDGEMVFTEYNAGGNVLPIDYRFGPGYGVPGHVMDTKSPYITADAANDPHVIKEFRAALGFTKLVDVPILDRNGALLGCFEIHDKKGGGSFDLTDVSLLEGLAAGAATALDNASLLSAVEDSEKGWEDTFDVLSELVTVQDREFRIVRANRAVARAFGLAKEEIIGKKCYELFHGLDAPVDRCPAGEMFAKGATSVTREVEVGDLLFEESVYPVFRGGEVDSFVQVAKDITGWKASETALREEKRKLEVVLESVADGISIQDTELRVLYQNPAHIAMVGEHTGEHCYRAYENMDKPCERCPVLESFKDGKTHKEVRAVILDGKERHFEIRTSVLRDDNNKIVAGIEAVREVTDIKEAEKGLEFERAKLVSLIDNLNEYAYVSDPCTYEVLYANRALKELLGKEPEGGMCYREFYGNDSPCKFCTNEIILAQPGKTYKWENRNPLIGKDLLLEDTIIRWPDGRDVRFEIAIDITDRKNIERRMDDFYDIIGHDLKSPIMAITGYSEILEERLRQSGDDESRSMVSAMHRSGEKLMDMVGDFLTVSRHDSGRLSLIKGPVDMAELTREVASGMEVVAARAGHSFTVKAADGIPLLMGDRKLIERALVNLLQNAVNYTPSGGDISIETSLQDGAPGFVVVSVSDNGPGIPLLDQPRIFEKYYRVGSPSTARGSGIGLAIVKAAADGHGGRVELDSTLGKGSTFRLYIPLSE